MTSTATTTSAAAPTTPEQARRVWPWLALQGLVLVALALVAGFWVAGGPRLLLAGVGLVGAARGVATLRAARAGAVDRQTALTGAVAVWLGLVAVGLAALPAVVTAWTFLLVTALALGALVVRSARRVRAAAVAVLGLAVLVVVGITGGADRLTGVATVAVAVGVLLLGGATVAAALTARRFARQPQPAVPAGCGGCACGAGGCGGTVARLTPGTVRCGDRNGRFTDWS